MKRRCGRDCFRAVTTAVEKEIASDGSQVYIEPDDLIPIVCCLLVSAQVPHLVAEINLCAELIGDDDRMGELGCHLANLQGAASVVMKHAAL